MTLIIHLLIATACLWILLDFSHAQCHLWILTGLFPSFQFSHHLFPVLLHWLGHLVWWMIDGHPHLIPNLGVYCGEGLSTFQCSTCFLWAFRYALFVRLKFSSIPSLLEVLYFKYWIDIIKCFLSLANEIKVWISPWFC